MSSSEWTTSGSACFRNHVYAWTFFFFIIFLAINKNEYNKLGGKNPPQI